MNQQERTVAILAQLEARGQMSVADICDLFGISKDTARRDIILLEEMELAERFHGGVRKPFLRPRLEAYRSRLITHAKTKRLLGRAAAELVQDNDTVMLDLSATVQFVGESITAENVFAVTNSVNTAMVLLNTSVEQVYLTGGILIPETYALSGMSVSEQIREFHFDIAFIGATAVRPEGIYYTVQDDITLKKSLKQISDKVVLVADHTKFDEIAPFRLDFSGIHIFITDAAPPNELMKVLKRHNINVTVTKEG